MDVRNTLKTPSGDARWRGTINGAGLTQDWIDDLIDDGYGRMMTVGAQETGIVGGGAGTVIDPDQPEIAIGVPEGTVWIPLRLAAQVEAGLIAADNDTNRIVWGVDTRGALQGPLSAETCTIETPTNMRTDLGYGSVCQCASAFTADMAIKPKYGAASDPYAGVAHEMTELARAAERADITTAAGLLYQRLELVYEPLRKPRLVGPCTVLGFWSGTVATIGGYAQWNWLEVPKRLLFRS